MSVLQYCAGGRHVLAPKIRHATGVSVFPPDGVTQMIEALDHNAVFGRGEVYLEVLFPHSAVLLFAFIVSAQRCAAQMGEQSPASRGLDTVREGKINCIRFGQILTNQASSFKRKTIKKGS